MNARSAWTGHRGVLFFRASDLISEPFPTGANLIAIATGRGRAISLEARVAFEVPVLETKASVVTSENFSPLLRGEAKRERKRLPLGPKPEESGKMMLKKSKATGGEGVGGSHPAGSLPANLRPDLGLSEPTSRKP